MGTESGSEAASPHPTSGLEVARAAVVRRAGLKGKGVVPQGQALGGRKGAGRRHRTGSGGTRGRAVLINALAS